MSGKTVFIRKKNRARAPIKHTSSDCPMVRAHPTEYLEIPAYIVDPAIPVCSRCTAAPVYGRIGKRRAAR